jgi:hypothetical protein
MSVYMPLDCDGFAAALADYLEGDAPTRFARRSRRTPKECADCSLLLADLQAIPRRAAALPALTPSRDLWSGIAERIDARVLPLQRPATQIIVPARRSWARPAIAAAALVIVTAGITHFVTRAHYAGTSTVASAPVPSQARESVAVAEPQVAIITPSAPPSAENVPPSAMGQTGAQRSASAPQVVASTPKASVPRAVPSGTRLVGADGVMNETEPVYDREITKLRTIVKSRRSTLDPATITVLEQSIAVIDSAIAQSRSALAKDPASGFLANQLNHSLEKKVELLRTAAMLPART